MLEKIKLNLRLLGISNIIMSMLGAFLFIRYPFNSATTNFNVGIAVLTLIIFFTDYYLNIRLVRSFTSLYDTTYGRLQKIIFRSYIVISFFTRLVIFSTSNFIIPPIEGDIILVSLSSILFAFLILYLRSIPAAVHVRGRLLYFFSINLLTVIYFAFPLLADIEFQGIPLGYIAVFTVGGFIKWLTYISGAFIFYTWSSTLPDKLKEMKQELYPEEEAEINEEDELFPEF